LKWKAFYLRIKARSKKTAAVISRNARISYAEYESNHTIYKAKHAFYELTQKNTIKKYNFEIYIIIMAQLNRISGIKLFSIALLYLVYIPFTSFGQEIIFKGLVKNSEGKLLDNAILTKKYKNKEQENSSVSLGKFSTVISDTANLENISFSYLGYSSVLVKAKEVLRFTRNNKNADFIVVLKIKDVDLSQIVVTDKHPFYQNENATVFDYEIMPNGNIILVMERKIYLINQQDSIIKSIQNTNGIDHIVKACSGKFFLCNKKALFPISINDTSLLISNTSVDLTSSLKQINELIACDTTIKIKESVSSHNQKIVYRLQPISDPSVEVNFYVAQNKEQMKAASAEKAYIDKYDSLAKEEVVPSAMHATFYSSMIGGGSGGAQSKSSLGVQSVLDEMSDIVWKEDNKAWKYEFYTSKKIYAPVFLHNDSIYIFDHASNKITAITYSKTGNELHVNTILKVPITYTKKPGWRTVVLKDSYTGEFFTAYRNERMVLNNIPLFGNTKQLSITLPKGHLFIDKVKIYNHTAYYLWRDLTNETSTWTLYKMAAE
jgi:hypothetical protein